MGRVNRRPSTSEAILCYTLTMYGPGSNQRRKGRPKAAEPKSRQFNFRLSEPEYQQILEAAGGYPPTTWARVELLKLANRLAKPRSSGG